MEAMAPRLNRPVPPLLPPSSSSSSSSSSSPHAAAVAAEVPQPCPFMQPSHPIFIMPPTQPEAKTASESEEIKRLKRKRKEAEKELEE
eukprot:423389-Amphidinium_carterae.1